MTEKTENEPVWLSKGRLRVLVAPSKLVVMFNEGWQVSDNQSPYNADFAYEAKK